MKLKTLKDTYEIVSANHENGKLNIVFENQSCEALQDIFSVKNDLARLEIYDHDERISIITEYVVLERVVLEDNHTTVVLGRESDDYSQRVTDLASKLAEASATASEMAKQSARQTRRLMEIQPIFRSLLPTWIIWLCRWR